MSDIDKTKKVPNSITINGEIFSYIHTRHYVPVSIFKGNNSFLRIGQKKFILNDLKKHKSLIESGFVVPIILADGVQEQEYYYIEKSIGNISIGDALEADYMKTGVVTDKNFEKFLLAVTDFIDKQINSAKVKKEGMIENLYQEIHMREILNELPLLKCELMDALRKIEKRLSRLPVVLTHGDFKASNIFERGIIDFERVFYAPIGYDLVTSIYHPFNYPVVGNYEKLRKYQFSKKQIRDYVAAVNIIFTKNGLPEFSDTLEEFLVARTIMFCARMHKWPKLQQWGYGRLEIIIRNYIGGRDITKITMQ